LQNGIYAFENPNKARLREALLGFAVLTPTYFWPNIHLKFECCFVGFG
jgi:hypothetical protein